MLSDICLAQKDNAGAESFAKRAMAIQERVLGPYHMEVAQAVRHVADLCEIGGKLSEADYEKSKQSLEKQLAKVNAEIASLTGKVRPAPPTEKPAAAKGRSNSAGV